MSKDFDFDDDDDLDLDEALADDDDRVPHSNDPEFDAIDPEFEGTETNEEFSEEEEDIRNPDGTLKDNWEEIYERQEKRRLAQKLLQSSTPLPGAPPPPPSGDLVVFEARPGNYIMAIGLPGSGKTVLQSHILHFLFDSSKYHAASDPDPDSTQSQLMTLNYWKQCWREGRFPEATKEDRADHFRYVIRTHHEDILNRRYKFGFVEVSGEHLRSIEGVSGQRPELPAALQGLLANKKCRIVFLLVCNPAKDPRRDDDFFQSFIDYFNFHPELAFRKESPIAFVLANPKAARHYIEPALNRHIERGHSGSERNNKLIEERQSVIESSASGEKLARLYLRYVMRRTKGALKGWEGPKKIFSFSVGTTKYNKDWGESQVLDFSFTDAKRVFSWAYHQTTRIKLPRFFGVKLFDDND